jgi:hypothetical protein
MTALADARVLLVERDVAQQRTLARTLRALVGHVDQRDTLAVDADLSSFDIVVSGVEQHIDVRTAVARGPRERQPRIVWTAPPLDRAQLAELFVRRQVRNMIAKRDGEVDPAELIITVRKLLEPRTFGVQSYFGGCIEPTSFTVRRSSQKAAVLAAAEGYAARLDVHSRLTSLLLTVIDEFVTNAVYNAPIDADARHRFAHVSREVAVELEPHEAVSVQLCSDGARLGISTKDPFGSLDAERVIDYMAKCFEYGDDQVDNKPGGAGVGIYQSFCSVSSLVVNIEPRRCTEFIGIIDVRGSYKDFAAGGKSFNLFVS